MYAVLRRPLTSCLILLACASGVSAVTVTESTDAGITPATAFRLRAGTTQVAGVITPGDYDLYYFGVDSPVTMTIYLGDSAMDGNLILFDGSGHGLEGDDDSGVNFDSQIVRVLGRGKYFVAAGVNNMAAFTDAGEWFIDNDSGSSDVPTAEALGYIGNRSDFVHGELSAYTLSFSSATGVVPEPSTMTLLILAAIGSSLYRFRPVTSAHPR